MSRPDMRIPIQFALSYPHRLPNDIASPDLHDLTAITFEKPAIENFRNLALAFEALEKGGNMPCILNAANEIGVQAFLRGQIGFPEITALIERCMKTMTFNPKPKLEDIIETDDQTRLIAKQFITAKD